LLDAMGDNAFFAKIIETYLREATKMLAAMEQAIQAEDASTLRLHAHTLKSNSADVGARHLSALCARIEEMAKAGTAKGTSNLVSEAISTFDSVKKALELVITTSKS
jgi:HPt (histidine-containing phosphotransfer) domain-containing protein